MSARPPVRPWSACTRVRSLALQVGGSLPLHAGAASRAILAQRAPEEWRTYLQRSAPLQRFTARTPVEPAAVVELLEDTLRAGIATSDQDVTIGVAAIGVPILDYEGRCRGALSISGVRESVLGPQADAWRAALLAEGQEVCRLLGAATPEATLPRLKTPDDRIPHVVTSARPKCPGS